MIPEDCDKFNTCNASVCPLDPRWEKTIHLSGEAVCLYLRNAVKVGADERYVGHAVYAACKERIPLIIAKFPDIARGLERAAKTGFKTGKIAELTKSQSQST